MSRLSAPLLAKIRAKAPTFDVYELDLPDGSTWCITHVEIASFSDPTGQHYDGVVTSWSEWREDPGDDRHAISVQALKLGISDVAHKDGTRKFRDLIGTRARIERSPFRAYMAAEGLAKSDWWNWYTGVLDNFPETGKDAFSLSIGPDDAALRSPILRNKANRFDWPHLPEENEGQILPLIIGKHSAEGRSPATGALTLFQINDSDYWHYAGLGRNKVLRVFKAGSLLTEGTDYTVEYPLVGGLRHTIVDLVANPSGSEITADIEGHYENGDGTGKPIMEAVDALDHLLSEYGFARYQDGDYNGQSSRIHAPSWAAVQSALSGRANGAAFVATFYVTDESTTLYDELNRWLLAMGVRGYWRGDGTLALFFNDPNTAAAPSTTLRESDCREPTKGGGPRGFAIKPAPGPLLGSVIGRWGRSATASGKNELEIVNPQALSDRADTVDLTSGPNTAP